MVGYAATTGMLGGWHFYYNHPSPPLLHTALCPLPFSLPPRRRRGGHYGQQHRQRGRWPQCARPMCVSRGGGREKRVIGQRASPRTQRGSSRAGQQAPGTAAHPTMRTPSPQKRQGVKRHPTTPVSPLVQRDHVRRRRPDHDAPPSASTAALAAAPAALAPPPLPSSPATASSSSAPLSTARQLSLQHFQLSRLDAAVAFLETERKLSGR